MSGVGLFVVTKIPLLSLAKISSGLKNLRQAALLACSRSDIALGRDCTSSWTGLSEGVINPAGSVDWQSVLRGERIAETVPAPACQRNCHLSQATAWSARALSRDCGKPPWRMTCRQVHTQLEERGEDQLAVPTNTDGARKEQTFVDRVRVEVKAGDGGSGCVSMWKSQAKGKFTPADGGNGGTGGDVIVQAADCMKSLRGVRGLQRAHAGAHGGKQKKVGVRGQDKVILVPTGTVVHRVKRMDEEPQGGGDEPIELPRWITHPHEPWEGEGDDASDEEGPGGKKEEELLVLADLVEDGQRVVVAKGGRGGRGNASYRTPPNRPASREREVGQPGEACTLVMELKTLADIGLVGVPNAGKSTLLRALSSARPLVASYPFTTLRPHLGTLRYEDGASLIIADIPGLIAGAAANKGLGHAFLRHIERTRALAYVVDLSSESGALAPAAQLQLLEKELGLYTEALTRVPAVVIANKIDTLNGSQDQLTELQAATSLPVVAVSALRGHGIPRLKEILRELSPTDS